MGDNFLHFVIKHELSAAQEAQKKGECRHIDGGGFILVLDWFYIANLVLVHQWTMDNYQSTSSALSLRVSCAGKDRFCLPSN